MIVPTGDNTSQQVITSTANPQIKVMRSLRRRKSRLAERAFLVEGRRLVEEAARDSGRIRSLLVRVDISDEWIDSLHLNPRDIRRVSSRVFDAASDVNHAQGVAAICDLPAVPVTSADIEMASSMILVLDHMRDPGNVGTALRSAAAAGVSIVLVSHGTADPFSPKAVRSGMGAHFRLRIGELSGELVKTFRHIDGEVIYADAAAPTSYTAWPWRTTCALIVGGETEALSVEAGSMTTARVSIPMQAGMESLNAGVAASVLMFEARRQRMADRKTV